MPDAHKNFARSTVATAPSPATSGTSLVLEGATGSKFPTVPFNATVWPKDERATYSNAEIVRVTDISTDTLTIVRAQESTDARSIEVGDQIAATITVKTLTDIEALLQLNGWIPSAYPFVYVSANSFKIEGVDLTSVISPGDKIKLMQSTGGTKYFYVLTASFSTDTTVTVTAGIDHTLANEAITAPFYSKAENPTGFTHWFNWTPGFTGFSADPTGLYNVFRIQGNQCFVICRQQTNGTSNATTFTMTGLPVASANVTNNISVAPMLYVDNTATGTVPGYAQIAANSTVISLFTTFGAAGWTNSGGKRVASITASYRWR